MTPYAGAPGAPICADATDDAVPATGVNDRGVPDQARRRRRCHPQTAMSAIPARPTRMAHPGGVRTMPWLRRQVTPPSIEETYLDAALMTIVLPSRTRPDAGR